jgi:RNA polymerase sigma-70 factor (ECF subfamily)
LWSITHHADKLKSARLPLKEHAMSWGANMDDEDFERLIVAIREGDRSTATALVQKYEPYLRRVVHARLADYGVRHVVESVDICQSIMADFFEKAEPDRFAFHSPDDLRGLLVTMALNKLRNRARHEGRRGDIPDGWDPIASDPSPSRVAAVDDEIAYLSRRLPLLEARLFDLSRVQGWSWDEIAREVGGKPDALRMRLTRAVARALTDRDAPGPGHGTRGKHDRSQPAD